METRYLIIPLLVRYLNISSDFLGYYRYIAKPSLYKQIIFRGKELIKEKTHIDPT